MSPRQLLVAFAIALLFLVHWGCASPRSAERSRGLSAKENYLATRYHDTYRATAELVPAAARVRVAEPSYANVEVREVPLDGRDPKAQLEQLWLESRTNGETIESIWLSCGQFTVVIRKGKP